MVEIQRCHRACDSLGQGHASELQVTPEWGVPSSHLASKTPPLPPPCCCFPIAGFPWVGSGPGGGEGAALGPPGPSSGSLSFSGLPRGEVLGGLGPEGKA